MDKQKIIDLLTPKCNGYELPMCLDVDLIADILISNWDEDLKDFNPDLLNASAVNYGTDGVGVTNEELDELSSIFM